MDLQIEGKWALVCAASKGLGKGCAEALVAEGVNVVVTARGEDALASTAAGLRQLNPHVHVHFFGTATLSFADGVKAQPGDTFEVSLDALGEPLRNGIRVQAPGIAVGGGRAL